LGGLESADPGGVHASTSCRSILDFATSNTVHPTQNTSVSSSAAKESAAELLADNRGPRNCQSSIADNVASARPQNMHACDESRWVTYVDAIDTVSK